VNNFNYIVFPNDLNVSHSKPSTRAWPSENLQPQDAGLTHVLIDSHVLVKKTRQKTDLLRGQPVTISRSCGALQTRPPPGLAYGALKGALARQTPLWKLGRDDFPAGTSSPERRRRI
jgi:hypothetical protein